MKKLLLTLISVILIFYSLMALFAWFFAENMIFQPPPSSYNDSKEIIKFHTEDGIELSAVYLPNPEAKFTILYSHGNAVDIGQLYPILQHIKQMGFSVFAYDYRGYGTSSGTPSEEGTYKDIEAAYARLTNEHGVSADRIIGLGQSLGGGAATELARRKPLAGLILESTFVTAYRVMTRIRLLPFDQYQNLQKIKSISCPVFVIHGTRDQVISFWHGKKLFKAANEPKQAYWVDSAGHNNLLDVAGESYQQNLSAFIDKIEKTQK